MTDDDWTCDGCGETFASEAALAGHERDCPEHNAQDTADDDTTTMTDTNTTDDRTETLRKEIEAILPGREPLKNLEVTRTGYAQYQVLSARNGGLTLQTVTLNEPSCTCGDWQFNLEDDEREVCAHFVAAFLEAEDVSVEDLAVNEIATASRELRQARDELEDYAEMMNGAAVEAREAQASAQAGGESQSTQSESVSPADAKESLVDAFEASDYYIRDAAVDGRAITFDIGHDEFEQLKAVTSQCDMVEYDGEQNSIDVKDVDQYITEYL